MYNLMKYKRVIQRKCRLNLIEQPIVDNFPSLERIAMNNWLDLKQIIPGLHTDRWLHVVNSPLLPLVNVLSENNFSVFIIDGSKIIDSKSLFEEAKNVFEFPDYFGENWNAWTDCLGDFEVSLNQSTAIIWDNADKSLMSDVYTFIQAVFDLYNMAINAGFARIRSEPCQVEVFLVGNSEGFKNVFDFKQK